MAKNGLFFGGCCVKVKCKTLGASRIRGRIDTVKSFVMAASPGGLEPWRKMQHLEFLA